MVYSFTIRNSKKRKTFSHVKDIPIPLLKDHDIQNKINDLALEANKKRYEAYKLEKKALEILDKEVIYAR